MRFIVFATVLLAGCGYASEPDNSEMEDIAADVLADGIAASSRIEDLEFRLDDLETQLADREDEIRSLQSEVQNLESQQLDLDSRISNVELYAAY